MRVVSIVGARPQFIKAAIVSPCLSKAGIREDLLHTGQHYDAKMSDAFFDELDIPTPTWSLGIGSGSHGAQTGAMLAGIESTLQDARPDVVLVYGDTNSTAAGALAASKLHVPVVHVEAGLRSFDRRMPEEINRIVTDHIADLLLAPTATAVELLAAEGIAGDIVVNVGDVMFDLAIKAADGLDSQPLLDELGLDADGFVLATVHRAENTDDPDRFDAIIDGLAQVAAHMPVVLPAHPRTRPLLEAHRRGHELTLIDPVGYLDMVRLERSCALVATDSGGVQKEAFFHGRPCVTLRDQTEWTELIELGWNRLVSATSADQISSTILDAIGSTGSDGRPYGDGRAGEAIADALAHRF